MQSGAFAWTHGPTVTDPYTAVDESTSLGVQRFRPYHNHLLSELRRIELDLDYQRALVQVIQSTALGRPACEEATPQEDTDRQQTDAQHTGTQQTDSGDGLLQGDGGVSRGTAGSASAQPLSLLQRYTQALNSTAHFRKQFLSEQKRTQDRMHGELKECRAEVMREEQRRREYMERVRREKAEEQARQERLRKQREREAAEKKERARLEEEKRRAAQLAAKTQQTQDTQKTQSTSTAQPGAGKAGSASAASSLTQRPRGLRLAEMECQLAIACYESCGKVYKTLVDRADPQVARVLLKTESKLRRAVNKTAANLEKIYALAVEVHGHLATLQSHGLKLLRYGCFVIAKALVSKAVTTVAKNHKQAFAVSLVAHCIMFGVPRNIPLPPSPQLPSGVNTVHQGFPGLYLCWLGAMFKNCQYCGPWFRKLQPDEPREKFLVRIGYRAPTVRSGRDPKTGQEVKALVWETTDSYYERMAGAVATLAAFYQIPSPDGVSVVASAQVAEFMKEWQSSQQGDGFRVDPKVFDTRRGPAAAWTWVARMANSAPKAATARMLVSFLRIAGYQLLRVYSGACKRLIRVIRDDLIPKLPTKTEASKLGLSQLKSFLEPFSQNGESLPVPDGYRIAQSQSTCTTIEHISSKDYSLTQ